MNCMLLSNFHYRIDVLIVLIDTRERRIIIRLIRLLKLNLLLWIQLYFLIIYLIIRIVKKCKLQLNI